MFSRRNTKMTRTMLSLLVLGLFAGVGTSAMAQNVTAGVQPNDAGTTTQKTAAADKPSAPPLVAEIDSSKMSAEYKAANDQAQADYTDAKVKCDTLKAGAMRACMKEARTVRTAALAQAKTQRDHPGETSDADTAKRGGTSTLQQKLPATPMK